MNLPLNIDWQQILLHMLNFVILAGGLWLLLYKPIKNFMDARENEYKKKDEETREGLKRAAELQSEYENHMVQAEADAEKIRADAIKEAETSAASIIAEAKNKSERIISDSRTAAEKERSKLLANTRSEIMQIALDATEKLIGGASEKDVYDSFINAQEDN